jgi:hypothetical protein
MSRRSVASLCVVLLFVASLFVALPTDPGRRGLLVYAHSAGRFRFRELAPVGTKNVLCLAMEVRIVVADAGGSSQTLEVRRLTGMISSFLFPIQSDIGAQSDHIVFTYCF